MSDETTPELTPDTPPQQFTMSMGELFNMMARNFAEANGYEGEIPDFSKDWEGAAVITDDDGEDEDWDDEEDEK